MPSGKQLRLFRPADGEIIGLSLPGKVTSTSWTLPVNLDIKQWEGFGPLLSKIEGAVQWWLGDWWSYGQHKYGARKALFNDGGPFEDMNFQTVMDYGWVSSKIETSFRNEVLSFTHHRHVAHLPANLQRKWLSRAAEGENGKPWSANELKSAIARQAAIDKTIKIDLDAQRLGKFVVLYADPPWQYENPPMGGSNRSIENHYPTMTLEQICALPVSDVAHENSILFMWATNPKLYECMKVLDAWEFSYRTDMVWIKDKIGMGYHARERHEGLLIAKRGELPPPPVEARPDSVIEAPRLEHSAKPPIFYDIIDAMYPTARKIELFGRSPEPRPLWSFWGNQCLTTI